MPTNTTQGSPPPPHAPESWSEHLDWVKQLAVRLARDEAGAEDLVQRTAIVALERPGALRDADGRGVRGWLGQVVRNEARNQWRSDRRRRDHESRAVESSSIAHDPRESEARLELASSVVGAVESLEAPYRAIILAKYFDHLSVKEIAKRHNLPERTVETRLHRGKKRLREFLAEHAPRGESWATLALASWDKPGAAAASGAASAKGASFLAKVGTMGLPIAIAAALLIALAVWGMQRPQDPSTSVAVEPTRVANPRSPGQVALAEVGAAKQGRSAQPTPVTVATAASQGVPQSVVVGKVQTHLGDALAGATVRLYSFKEWRAGVDTPAFEVSDVPMMDSPVEPEGYLTETGADGRFTLEVPVPTASQVMCVITAGPFHDRWTASLSLGEGSAPPLQEGHRDLGTIALGPTGAVEGRVLNAAGQPIAMARVGLGASSSGTLGLDVFTNAQGQFTVGHAPEGTFGLRVKHPGSLALFHGDVEIIQRSMTGPIELTLQPAPILAGVVVDEEGSPLQGVVVGGWPQSNGGGGKYARAISGADGRFEITLPQTSPYSLAAKKTGFQTWGAEHDPAQTYAPGTVDLEITMAAVEPIVVRVVDDATDEPVTSYGFYLLPSSGRDGDRPIMVPRDMPPVAQRPDGTLSVPGREGLDAYLVYVEGRAPFTGTLDRNSATAPHLIIRLKVRPSIRGRFLRHGEPVSGASVVAMPGRVASRSIAIFPGEAAAERAAREELMDETSLTRFEPDELQEVRTTTDENGQFEVTGLDPKLHALRLVDESMLATVIYPVDASEGPIDLGDIEAQSYGSISGRLLLPAGVSPSGLKVELKSLGRKLVVPADETGRFLFRDLPTGQYEMICRGRREELGRTLTVPVKVNADAESQMDIDCLPFALTPARLTVLAHGEPLLGAFVFVRDSENPQPFSMPLGATDETGTATGFITGSGTREITVSLGNTAFPPEVVPRIEVQAGTPIEEIIQLDLAELSVTVPETVSFPAEGEVHLFFQTGTDPFDFATYRLPLANGQIGEALSSMASISGRTLTIHAAPKVECQVSFMIAQSQGERTSVEVPGTTMRTHAWPSLYATVFQMDCASGNCAPIVLTE